MQILVLVHFLMSIGFALAYSEVLDLSFTHALSWSIRQQMIWNECQDFYHYVVPFNRRRFLGIADI